MAMLPFSNNVIQIVRLPRETDACVPHACKAVGFQGNVVHVLDQKQTKWFRWSGVVLCNAHFFVILVSLLEALLQK